MGKMKGGPVCGSLPATSAVVRVDLPASLRWLRMRPAAGKRVVMRDLNGQSALHLNAVGASMNAF